MIGNVIKYGAVCAKARAMHGKCLKQDEWDALRACTSIRQIWDILRQSPAWAMVGQEAMASEDPLAMSQALSAQLKADCVHLKNYLTKKDASTLKAFLDMHSSDQGMKPEDYRSWWRDIRRDTALRSLISADVDSLNLVYTLRLRAFGATEKEARSMLIPIRGRFTEEMASDILHMESDSLLLEYIRKTSWKDTFRSLESGELEKQYRKYLAAFCSHVMSSAQPGMAVVQAFLELKDLERRQLTRMIGAVERGIDPALVI